MELDSWFVEEDKNCDLIYVQPGTKLHFVKKYF